MGPMGGSICIMRNLLSPGRLLPTPYTVPSSVPSYPVYTASEQDLGMPYQPVVVEYARSQYGGLVNIPKYGILVENPLSVKMRSNTTNGFLRWRTPGKCMGRPW